MLLTVIVVVVVIADTEYVRFVIVRDVVVIVGVGICVCCRGQYSIFTQSSLFEGGTITVRTNT